jgi:RNA polymerase primary sigma factor
MSILYKIDSEVKKKFPDLKETVHSKIVQDVVESIIGQGTNIDFIKGYLEDKGYLYIDIPKIEKIQDLEFQQKPVSEKSHHDLNLKEKSILEDDDDFDLDAFFESDKFEKEMKKLADVTDYTNNKKLFDALLNHQSEGTKNEIIIANIPLVNKIASNYKWAINGSMDYDDFVSEGIYGLMKAVDRYNITLGYEFSTYAYYWIKQSITRAIADKSLSVRLPVHLHETLNKINSVERESWKNSEQIDSKKVAEKCGMSIKKYEELKTIEYRFRHSTSINTPLKDNADEDIIMMLGYESSIWLTQETNSMDPVQVAESIILKQEIAKLFEHLTPKEGFVLQQRFGLFDNVDKTLEEVGLLLGVTRERVRQIQVKAIRKLINTGIKMELKEFLMK